MKKNGIKIIISIIALGIIVVRVIWPNINIDNIAIYLLAIAIVPWVMDIFKTIEIPNFLKIELKEEIQSIQQKVSDNSLFPVKNQEMEPIKDYGLNLIFNMSPTLALVSLRKRIEDKINELITYHNLPSNRIFTKNLEILKNHRILNKKEFDVIKELLPILNQAAHSENIDNDDCITALELGINILQSLDERTSKLSLTELIQQWNAKDGALGAELGEKLSKEFVRHPILFMELMTKDITDFNSWLNSIETHTFHTFEDAYGDDLDMELIAAPYEKLKNLMLKEAENLNNTKYKVEANRIISSLNNIEIRFVF